jgi:hypothetical protein
MIQELKHSEIQLLILSFKKQDLFDQMIKHHPYLVELIKLSLASIIINDNMRKLKAHIISLTNNYEDYHQRHFKWENLQQYKVHQFLKEQLKEVILFASDECYDSDLTLLMISMPQSHLKYFKANKQPMTD